MENGSDDVVTIFQDDASRSWFVRVGRVSYCGNSFSEAIGSAIKGEGIIGSR